MLLLQHCFVENSDEDFEDLEELGVYDEVLDHLYFLNNIEIIFVSNKASFFELIPPVISHLSHLFVEYLLLRAKVLGILNLFFFYDSSTDHFDFLDLVYFTACFNVVSYEVHSSLDLLALRRTVVISLQFEGPTSQ